VSGVISGASYRMRGGPTEADAVSSWDVHAALVASQTGNIALHLACWPNHMETAEMLIDRGADVAAVDDVRHWYAVAFAAVCVCACPALCVAIVSCSARRDQDACAAADGR